MKGKRKKRRDRAAEGTRSLFEDEEVGAAGGESPDEAGEVERSDARALELESAERTAPAIAVPETAPGLATGDVGPDPVQATATASVELEPVAVSLVDVENDPEPALEVVWEPEGPEDAAQGVAVQPEPLVAEAVATADRLAEARDLVARGRIDDAAALYRDLLMDEPGNLKAYNNLGLLYEGMGRFERALEQFERARAIEPDNVTVAANVGGALIGLGRFDEAERELRRAMKLDLENVDVRANVGILYFRRGQYVQAENELRWVCEREADHAAAHYYRGEALNRLNKVDKAIEVLERAAELQPGNAKIYHTMGILFDKKNMPAEASRMYRKVRDLSNSGGLR
jgi:tetratricopeptide (TPR) repeat protein